MALMGSGGGASAGAVRAGGAFVELFVRNNLTKGLADAQKQFLNFGKSITMAGRNFLGVGLAGSTALGGLFAASTKRGAEFAGLATKLGDTTENLSAFAYAASTTGIKLEGLLDNFENWPERLSQAAAGAGEMADTFNRLGIDAAKMKELPLTEQLIQLAEAMRGVGNNTDRLAILGNLFSDKGQGFNELFKKGGDGIRELMREAGAMGAVVSTQQAEQAKEIERAWGKAWSSVKFSVLEVGNALLPTAPAIAEIGQQIAAAAKEVRLWVGEHKELVLGIGAAFAGLTAVGGAMLIAGPAMTGLVAGGAMLGTAFAAVGSVVATIFTPLGAGVFLVGVLADELFDLKKVGADAFGAIANAISNTFGETWQNLKDGWGGVVGALGKGDLNLAFEIGVATLEVEWTRFTNFMTNVWEEVKNTLIKGFRDVADEFEAAADLDKQFTHLTGGAVLQQKKERGFIRGVGPSPMQLREQELQNKRGALAALLGRLDDPWADFGGGADFGAGFKGAGGIAAQLADLATRTTGGWGGAINAGVTGQGNGVDRIVKGLKDVEKAVEKNGRINVMRGDIVADAIMVHEGG